MTIYPNQKKCLLCFANEAFYTSQNRLIKQAKNMRIFNTIISVKDTDLSSQDKYSDFWKQHSTFIKNNKRGYGYWIWKSYLTLKTLNDMNENDILFYVDSGCELNPLAISRLIDYIKIVNKSDNGILTFHLGDLTNKQWCKMDAIELLEGNEYMDNGQILATMYVIRKCPKTMDFVEKWYDTVCNYHNINDVPSVIPNHVSFNEHRHDQSIFSLLCYKLGAEILPDETFYHPNWIMGINSPVWAVRNKSDISYVTHFLGKYIK